VKFGVNTLLWAESFGPAHFELLPRLKEAGFDGVEFPIFDPVAFAAGAIRREVEKSGLECTACSILPAGSSLAAPDPAQRKKAKTHLEAAIHASAEMGATLLAGPLYSPVGYFSGGRRTETEWHRAVESWQEIAPTVQAAGIEVAIEPLNRFETYFLNTVEDAAAFCDEVGSPRVGILVDTFHANIEEKSIGRAIERAGRHLKHLHTCENDRGTPGTGHVRWTEFFDAVKKTGYDGWLTIESFGFTLGGLSAAASIWRDLAASPETIAFEGVKFLRKGAI
jgi:D-psicose/D-tagatose/L-ribulose 3-epimerase